MNYFSWTVFQCCVICLCLLLCCSIWITSIATFTDGLCAGLISKPEPKCILKRLSGTKNHFYVRQHICCSAYMLSSVCPSDGWIIEKQLKLGLWNFQHTVAPPSSFCSVSFIQKFKGVPPSRASNKGGVGKISSFLSLHVNISKTVANTAKVRIND